MPCLTLVLKRVVCGIEAFVQVSIASCSRAAILAAWFRDIVRVIFGSLDDEGVRHVPEVFALVGKKNSRPRVAPD